MDDTGIKPIVLEEIGELAKKYRLKRVILFGSRARGDYDRISDIDLAVEGDDRDVDMFSVDVDECTSTLLKYDIIHLTDTMDRELLQNIRKEGKILYEEI